MKTSLLVKTKNMVTLKSFPESFINQNYDKLKITLKELRLIKQ